MTTEQEAHRIRHCAEQVVLAARSDPAAAAELVREMESIAGQHQNPLFDAYSNRAKGHLLHIRGSMTEAVKLYRVALALFDQCQEHVERARTASTLVGALVPLGDFEEALSLAEQARQVFQQENLQLRAARLDVNVGNLYHRLNRLEDALMRYERAAPLLENSKDYEATAGVLINRAVMSMLLYRFDDALRGFQRARAFSEEHGLRVFSTQSEYNRGYLLFLIGDYAEALNLMQVAETGFRGLGDEVHVAHCRLDRAEILLELNLPEQSIELASLAEDGFRSAGLNGDRSRALLVLGRCLIRQGRTGEAVSHYTKARSLFQAENNNIWSAMADLEIASACMASGELHEAEKLAERSGELFRTEQHFPFSALADALGARLRIERNEPSQALSLLSRCEESLKFQLPACLRYHIEYLKGRALELLGHVEQARRSYRVATESLEFLLTHISVDQAMTRFLEDKEDVYERLAGLTEYVPEALDFADRARTRALTVPWNLRERSKHLSDKARSLRETLRSDHLRLFQSNQKNPAALFDKIKQSEQQLMQEMMDVEIREAGRQTAPSGARLEQQADEVLLEYFLRDNNVSVFVRRNDALERITLPISADNLLQELNFIRFGLSSAGDPRREPALHYHLKRLHDALIAPVKAMLRPRVVIVSHRFLYDLPFHLLLGPTGYLAEEYLISYSPSMAAYALTAQRDRSYAINSLIIGADSADLPEVDSEVREVASNLPNCAIATNKKLEEIRSLFETATFIHIASHGLFRHDSPAWSLLNLGSDVLTPADLLNMRVNAEMVTMSACSTGQAYARGNEVHGFVRAFSQWGVPSLIASLWQVSDRATSMLMKSFYCRLQNSPDIAENLRSAMLEVKKEFAHPYYWGGFVLIGRQKLGRSWERIKND